ncbi:MAG TPA: transposase [Solirubrobacteraceae bacterium]|nr:transposase [Solirubrobacteraceae bacterium]
MTSPASLWAQRVAKLEASGQSCKEYARRIGVNPNTLAGWRWKLRRNKASAGEEAQQGEPNFVEVTQQIAASLAQEVGEIELDVRRGLVRLHGPVDAGALATVLDVLEGRR